MVVVPSSDTVTVDSEMVTPAVSSSVTVAATFWVAKALYFVSLDDGSLVIDTVRRSLGLSMSSSVPCTRTVCALLQFDVENVSVSEPVNAMDESGPSISAPVPAVTTTDTLLVGCESSTTV